jgi:cobalt-zinc-cadmium efflux system membrane fusion protein
MDKKQIFVTALALSVGMGIDSFWMGNTSAPSTEALAQEEHGHDDHDDEGGGKDSTEGKHAEGETEEGHLTLSDEQISSAGIQLAEAKAQNISLSLPFPGEIRFDEDRTAHVVPRVPGVVESVNVNLGQPVKKGQLLAVIASQQISDQRSEQVAAQRRLELARTTYERERQLWQDKISAEQDFLQARQALQESEIALSNARQKISVLSGSSVASGGNRYELRAPFDGVVVEKHLGLGEVVSETTNAFTLSDLSRVWVTFGVSPKDLNKVLVGKSVTVSAPELSAEVTGTVAYVGNLLGEQTRTATVRVTLANPQGAWRPGLFVTVLVDTDTRQTKVAVPEAAIQTVEDKPTVFVRTDDGFKAQPVEIGSRAAGLVEITEGLETGVQVAATGSFILKSELGKASAEHAH